MPWTVVLNGIVVNIKKWNGSLFNLKNCIFFYYLYCSAWHISLCFSFPCNCQPPKLLFFFIMFLLHSDFFLVKLFWGGKKKQTSLSRILLALRFSHAIKKKKTAKFMPREKLEFFHTFYRTKFPWVYGIVLPLPYNYYLWG